MKRKTIEQWEAIMKDSPTEHIKKRLALTLEDIALLESIYMTGGQLNHFSEQFSDAAHNERQALCQLSSACYSLLKEREKQPVTA
jgi:hypothetical protein